MTKSQITSPSSDPTFQFFQTPFGGGSSQQSLTVTGTSDGTTSDEVVLGCFYTDQTGTKRVYELENLKGEVVHLKIHSGGSFSTEELSGESVVSLERLVDEREQPCTLRAVPPTTLATDNVASFKGPRDGQAEVEFEGKSESELFENYMWSATTQGYWGWDSASDCGPYGHVFDPTTFQEGEPSWISDCEATLYGENNSDTGASIVIDGHNGYGTWAAEDIHSGAPGQEFLTSNGVSFDATNGNLTVTWTEPLVRCEKSDGSAVDQNDPSSTECQRFASTGVKLVRTVSTGQNGLQATVTDKFESSNGSSHTITLRYNEEQSCCGERANFQFPGEAGFSFHEAKDTAPTGSHAPETVFFQANPGNSVDPTNGLENPWGAITFSAVPSHVTFSSNSNFEAEFAGRTVPSSGSMTIVHVLSQALSQSEISTLAQAAEASLPGPSVAISSPANGTTVATPTITVSGTASAKLGVQSVTVNGVAASLSGESWSATVPLTAGANTLTATATDTAGATKAASETVAYTPPVSPKPPAPAFAAKVGAVKGANGKITLKLACKGTPGTSCRIQIAATTTERTRNGRLLSIAAAHHKIRSKKVTVASLTVVIPAGKTKTVTLTLNRTGRKLLARYHHLPVALSAVLIGTGNKKTKLFSQTLTVKPPPPPRHKHRRKH